MYVQVPEAALFNHRRQYVADHRNGKVTRA
jgi:hypothetical protein